MNKLVLRTNKINYRKSSKKLKEAYFKWKAQEKQENHNVVSFAAGFNAGINNK